MNTPIPGAEDRFARCLAETLNIEGGYSNDPHDPGGPTMRGVTWKVYNSYRDSRGLPRRDVRQIEREEVVDIYRRSYWVPSHAGDMPAGLDLAVWDFGVNSGPVTALIKLQRVLGVPADGHYGMVTAQAVAQAYPATLIKSYMNERRTYCRGLSNYWKFKNGWEARWNRVEASALAAAGQIEWSARVDVTPPPEDPHERAAEQGRAVGAEPSPPAMAEMSAAGSGATTFGFALPNIIARGWPGGKFSPMGLLMGIISEPLFWAGVAMVWGAVAFWLYRKRTARNKP